MAFLSEVSITFNTHGDSRDHDTVLHVFVKNRRNNSLDPEENTTFIGNLTAYQRLRDWDDSELNPYLAFGKSLSQGVGFGDPSSNTFILNLRSNQIRLEDIILPVVNIHILPNGSDLWIFDYTVTFKFDDGRSFSSSSNKDGVKGISLNQDNRDHSGICTESPFITLPQPTKPVTNAVLTKVTLDFGTHDDDKVASTHLNVHITNRLSASSTQDIAIGLDIFANQAFPNPSKKTVVWPSANMPLASTTIKLQDMVLPVVNIIMLQNTQDRWIFDYRVTYEFTTIQTDGTRSIQTFTSRSNGIILDQNYNKYSGIYQGNPFPTVTPATSPIKSHSPIQRTKYISFNFLQQKFNEFINNRQGLPAQDPPLTKLRLHNSGFYVDGNLPESYFDLQSITAVRGGVNYKSSPVSLGQLTGTYFNIGELYLNDINSKAITLNVDATSPTPLTLKVDFETGGPDETIGGFGEMNFLEFSITLKLTLDLDAANGKIDVMSWAKRNVDPSSVIDVHLVTSSTFDPGDTFASKMTDKIYEKLKEPNLVTSRTIIDDINSAVNSLLLGGMVDDDNNINNNVVHNVHIEGDNLVITYSGPQNNFIPSMPKDWPNASTNPNSIYDFSPGNLANIDHVVVLTMENRSFDHMLGYLSLPLSQGGMGRTEVDGLKGGEFNTYNGTRYPSHPLSDTFFSPDPPHGYEPVQHAINGGQMDGFVKSYAEEHGNAVAGNIMGYQPAANVPVYDALARDFTISHRWFASHPGPTFCNRFYELSGRLNTDEKGFWEFDNSSRKRPVFTKTIFDYLTDYGQIVRPITWKYFEHSYCFLRFFESYTFDHANIVNINDPQSGFFACASNGTLPSVSFIDPHFIEMPPHANCDGAPADIKDGQALVQKIVEAVVASPNWKKTLLIITYDEHGGFFDHVAPPQAVKVSAESPINTYGIRVPAFIISPWVGQGQVVGHDAGKLDDGLYFDHTSILKTIARRFMTDYPPYMGARYASAKDLSQVVGNTLRNTQFLPFIRYNVVYNASQKSLDVKSASNIPGSTLWQYNVNDTEAQHFSFEDAGDGYFYIRTHCGNLYVTVDVPGPIVAPNPNIIAAPTLSYNVKQDTKYRPGNVPDLNHNPAYQKWKMTPVNTISHNLFIISNAFFPDKVLQPINNTGSGVAVVVGDKTPGGGATNAWKISSPLINNQIVVNL